MVAQIDKFLDATSKIRMQKTKCRCDGGIGIKIRFRISHLIIQHITKLFILTSLLGRSRDLEIPEASFDPDFEILPVVHPGGA